MKDWRVASIAIIVIGIIETTALVNKVDGALLGIGMLLIGAVAGISADFIRQVLKK